MTKQYHTDGREIIRCRSLTGVKRAFAAGAIAHLIEGSVTIEVSTGNVTLWASGSATADMWASGSATATMGASGSATATMRAYGSATADMGWTSDATPDPATAARLKYKIADADEAEANIREVAAFVKRERAAFNMGSWHSRNPDADGNYPCGTTHCMAGAAVMLKGDQGREMERLFGTERAGLMLLGREAASYFHLGNEAALDFLASKLGEPIT